MAAGTAHLGGAIDFDFCSPGPRLWALAYAAYRLVPLMPVDAVSPGGLSAERSLFSLGVMGERLGRFLDAYAAGSERLRYENGSLLAATVERLGRLPPAGPSPG